MLDSGEIIPRERRRSQEPSRVLALPSLLAGRGWWARETVVSSDTRAAGAGPAALPLAPTPSPSLAGRGVSTVVTLAFAFVNGVTVAITRFHSAASSGASVRFTAWSAPPRSAARARLWAAAATPFRAPTCPPRSRARRRPHPRRCRNDWHP